MDDINDEMFERGELEGKYQDEIVEERRREKYIPLAKKEILEDPSFLEMVKQSIIDEGGDLFLKISNSKYTRVVIEKNIEGYFEIKGSIAMDPKIPIVEIKKLYPNASISIDIHKGKFAKIIVVEKVRVDK